jgi:hypothetical protein
MIVYLSKPMIMRINPYVGISRMRRYRMVYMCKGKRKYDYEAPMTSSLSDCTWLEKESKFFLSTTWHPSLHFYFFLFTWFIPLISFLPLLFFLSLLFLIPSYTYIYILYTFLLLLFFLFHTHTFLFIFPSLDIFSKLSTPLYHACIQSEILNKPC